MRRASLVTVLLLVALTVSSTAFAQSAPQFKLGFATLASMIPDVAGQPLENEHYGANGDSLQQTTTGLMVWRKADNWTAFTNGYMTWINGPHGLQSRLNTDRFDWEKNQPSSTSQPATSSSTALPIDKSLLGQCQLSYGNQKLYCNLPVGTDVYAVIDGRANVFSGSRIELHAPNAEAIWFYSMSSEAEIPSGNVKAGDLMAKINAATTPNSEGNFILGLGKPLPPGALGPGIVGGYADMPLPSFITDLAKPYKP